MQKQIIVIILALLGLYLLLVHQAPLPFNHEEIGLGTNHPVHGAIGIILLVGAGFLWHKNRKKKVQA